MITKGMLTQVYGLLSQAQLDKCDVKERIEIIKVLRKVRPEVESVQGFIDDIRNKNADILGSDTVRLAELNKAVNEELVKKAETKETNVLTGETLMHLVESNGSWNAAVIMAIEDVFKKAKNEK